MKRVRLAVIPAVGFLVLFAIAMASRPAGASMQETVRLASGSTIALATPPFIVKGKRYAFSWPGGGPQQTHTIKSIRSDGWVEVQVAEENLDPAFLAPGQTPTRWLHVGLAVSIQEMRTLPY